MKNTRLAYIIGIAGAISWGVSFIAAKTALDYMEPIQVMAVRMTVAVITFGAFILIGSVKLNFKNKSIKSLLILSIAQPCLYGVFEIWGIDITTASESAIILSMVPIIVTVLSAVFFKERIKFMTAGFVFLSFLGVIVTVMGNLSASGKIIGYMFLLLAVITGAVYAILFLGVICSVFAFIAYNHLIATVPAYKASTLILSVLTVTGVIAGVAFRGDPFTIYKLTGLILILAGVIGVSQSEIIVNVA